MIDRDEAVTIARKCLDQLEQEPEVPPLALIESGTREGAKGWAFFYQSKEWVESGEVSAQLAGNGPVVVKREDGTVEGFGSSPEELTRFEDFMRE